MKYRTLDRIKNGIEFALGPGIILYLKSGEISNQFLSGNVPDIIYPITNYTGYRALFSEKPSLPLALGMAGLGTIAEVGQHFGLYPGTFDIKDIPMYFIGAGLAYGIDRITYNSEKANLEQKL